MRVLSHLCAGLALAALPVLAQPNLDLASFDRVWTAIRDTHWEAKPGGLDWQAMREEYRPRVERARSTEEARAAIQEMLGRLKQTHFAIVPAAVYSALEEDGGEASTGIDLRVLEGQAVVTAVDAGSPADAAGVRSGWVVRRARGQPLAALIEQAAANPEIHELQLTRALLARLSGRPGAKVAVEFLDGDDRPVLLELPLAPPRGALAQFGNLPPMPVWYEERRLGRVAYVRFNVFLDLPRIVPAFGQTVAGCGTCSGLILDLRGNPGGIGGMAMSLAGFLVEQADLRLGTMYLKDTTLNFVINPRPDVFSGPVAILVDGLSASTSEILAGGLRDLGRARVFGTRSAAAALPSVFERLPNGDGFQHAVANYVSRGGKALEGHGVVPDVEVKLTRRALLEGRDPVIDSAVAWIEGTSR